MAYVSRCCLTVVSAALATALTGCALTATAPSTPVTAPAIKGSVFGGQQPVVGAHVYVLAANTTGYNTTGATNPSVSLLQASSGTTKDSNGNYYVTTGTFGSFSITNEYSCTPGNGSTPGQQVYLYAVGGTSDPYGSGAINNAIGLMAVLGDCPASGNFAAATPIVQMNEVTTVAAAYAMAGFAYDATHVSSSGSNLAKVGVRNAFANASNLASLSTGLAYTTTPAANGGNGAVPQTTINTLANILAACINTNGAITAPVTSGPDPISASPCYTLLYDAQSGGSFGTVPTDTATAAINIAHNPGSNVSTLFALPSATAPFIPVLSNQPNDFTIGINYTGGTLVSPRGIAIDATGDVWITNASGGTNNIVKLSSTGAVLSGTTGFTGSNTVYLPIDVAIDASGNAWVANYAGSSVSELSSTGQLLGGGPYTGGGIVSPWSIAIDGPGNVWVASSGSPAVITKLSSAGAVLSGTTGYTGGGLSGSLVIAIDGSANAWIGDGSSANNVVKLSSSGSVLSGANGYVLSTLPRGIAMDGLGNAWVPSNSLFEVSNSGSLTSSSNGYTSGGIKAPYYGVAIDGLGDVWVANTNNSVSQFGNTGSAISPTTGYTGGQQGFGWGIAIDGSGDTWVANFTGGSITELIGAATPVITPICAGLPSVPTSNGTSSLGTRP
jgi:hypothetical protein